MIKIGFFILTIAISSSTLGVTRCELGQTIAGLKLGDLDLSRCDLGRASWRTVEFNNLNLEKAIGKEISIVDVKMDSTKALAADFAGGVFDHVVFIKSNLKASIFRGAHFTNVRFVDCDLSDSDFTGARIAHTDFGGSDLSGANFSQVVSFRSEFKSAKKSSSTK